MASQSTDSTEVPSSENSQVVSQKSEQPGQDQQVQQIPKQPQIFYQIVDVINEYQKGNFLPALHCLRYNLIPKNFMDYTGYNLLHIAVSQGQIPVVLLLLDHFKLDVNIRSTTQQTPLMIACNYGLLEIIRILCERGAQINPRDNTGFSALLYAVKMGRVPEVAYLLHQEADIHACDVNGCSVAHWAAYKNDLFLLKTFKSLGVNIHGLDNSGLTPLERAVQSNSIECVKFLLQCGDGKMPANLKFAELPESDLKTVLRKKYFPTKTEAMKEKYTNMFLRKSRWGTFAVYLIIWFSLLGMFLRVVSDGPLSFTVNLTFLLLSLYFIGYSFWYYTRSHKITTKSKNSSSKKTSDDSMEMNNLQPIQRLNSEALDKLIKGENFVSIVQEEDSNAFPSYLHELAWHFDNKNYRELARFNQRDYCPSCLVKRPERSYHPERSYACVPHFHHYSYTLGKPINKENHYLYLLLIVQQQILLGFWLVAIWMSTSNVVTNPTIWIAEVGYRLYETYSLGKLVLYLLAIVLASYNTFFFFLEIYGVLRNVTYNEIFNRNKLNYLFGVRREKKGGFVKGFNNPYDVGIKGNIKDYVMRVWNLHSMDEQN